MREPFSIALNCPSCGAATTAKEGDRIISCAHCGSRHVLAAIKGAIRYVVPFSVSRDDAKNAVLRYFKMKITARDMIRQGYLRDVTPLYIPFWRISEKYLGWLMERRRHPQILRRGTVFNLPACSVKGLGFSSLTIGERDLKETRLFQPEEAQREAIVYDVTIPSENVLKLTRTSDRGEVQFVTPSTLKRTKRISVSLFPVYLPFWLVKYSYRGRFYQAMIDGRRERIISARFPANLWTRLAPMVGVFALISLLVTTIVPMLADILAEKEPNEIQLVILCLAVWTLAYLSFMVFFWSSNTYALLRYGREVRIEDSRRIDLLPGSRGQWTDLFRISYQDLHSDILTKIRKKGLLGKRDDSALSLSDRWMVPILLIVLLAVASIGIVPAILDISQSERSFKTQQNMKVERNMHILEHAVRHFAGGAWGHYPADINTTVKQVLGQMGFSSDNPASVAGAGELDSVKEGEIGLAGPTLLPPDMANPLQKSSPVIETVTPGPPSWSVEVVGTVFYVPLDVHGRIARAYKIYGAGPDGLVHLVLSSED
jgi:hypothetical protein